MTRFRLAAGDTFRSLQHRNFRLYFTAQAVSFTGTWLQLVAQTLLMLRLTDSGAALGLLVACQFAPTLLLGAWAGVVIDRHDRRHVVTVSTSVMLVAAALLGVLVLADQATVPVVYALAAVLGLANTFDNPARRSLVSEIVPPEDLGNAINLNSTLVTLARLLGPALAGLLVVTVGVGWCFIVNALTFVAVLVSVRRMDVAAIRATPPVKAGRGQVREGLRYAWSVDDLRIPLLLMTVVGTFGFNFHVLLPLLATRELGGTEATYTLLMVFFSLGSMVGALALARRRIIDIPLLGWSAVVLGVGGVALAGAPNLPFAIAALVVSGLAGMGVLSGSNAVVTISASPQMRGRVLALFTVVFLGSTPIGGPIAGWMAEAYGTRVAVLGGALASLLAGLAVVAAVPTRSRGNDWRHPPAISSSSQGQVGATLVRSASAATNARSVP